MVRWLRWHCPPDTGFEIRALVVWGRARHLSVTEAPHNTNFHTWMGKKQFCFFQTAETGNRTPDSGVKGSGANHYPRADAIHNFKWVKMIQIWQNGGQLFSNRADWCHIVALTCWKIGTECGDNWVKNPIYSAPAVKGLIQRFNPYSAGIDFSRQNLTFVDVFWRLKAIPVL